MIRRDAGDSYLLITQHDHALLAGRFARHLGNSQFAQPDPRDTVIDAIANHDCGWPLHDDQPTIDPRGRPLHVFQATIPTAVAVWAESVTRAAALGDYPALLVSLHVMNLAAMAVSNLANATRRQLFELNKFQHKQVEIQEELRPKLGMTNEHPRHLGLAERGAHPADDLLRFNFRLLTAMDRISLALCAGEHLFPEMKDVHTRPDAPPALIRCAMPTASIMTLDPWPFDRDEINEEAPTHRVPKRAYAGDDDFRAAYASAKVQPLMVSVRRGIS